jgi:hypothetical protein
MEGESRKGNTITMAIGHKHRSRERIQEAKRNRIEN